MALCQLSVRLLSSQAFFGTIVVCDSCFQCRAVIMYKSNLVIIRYDLAASLFCFFFFIKFLKLGNIARLHIIETSTSNEPVIGH